MANVPLILMVPVVGSTALSTKEMRPVDTLAVSFGGLAATLIVPMAMYRFSSGNRASGMPNVT